ncbi:hypothetical protein Syun_029079 [Stephania yunnanensis]|uniref:Uncharacterized protein n=1 Tax=Stephania yunnanensis TaxID=152371 RepID=A0AAP0HL19_9MAGN
MRGFGGIRRSSCRLPSPPQKPSLLSALSLFVVPHQTTIVINFGFIHLVVLDLMFRVCCGG